MTECEPYLKELGRELLFREAVIAVFTGNKEAKTTETDEEFKQSLKMAEAI